MADDDASVPSLVLVGATAYLVGLATRLVPLYWSPLPATLDGFGYAETAAATIRLGALPAGRLASDSIGFSAVLSVASLLSGIPPLQMAQPLTALLGATGGVVAAALLCRVGRTRGWSRPQRRAAAALAGLLVAVEGLFVRRTGVPDEGALGLVIVPLVVLATYLALRTGRRAWTATAVGLWAFLLPLHTLTSVAATLSVTALLAGAIVVRPTSRRIVAAAVGIGGGWTVLFGYYALAPRVGLETPYTELVRPHLGLFVAWLLVLAAASAHLHVTARGVPSRARGLVAGGLLGWPFVLVAVNAVRPVFPGSVPTHPVVLVLVVPLVVPAGLAALAVGIARVVDWSGQLTAESALLAALVGPVGGIYYLLTAGATPAFVSGLIRLQTFAHVGLLGTAVGAAVWVLRRRPVAGRVLVAGLVVATAATLPLAYIHLDTATVPSTTLASDYAAATTAAARVDGPVAMADGMARVSGGTDAPVTRWLRGGPPPACPTLTQASWSTTGAHLFPAPSVTLSSDAHRAFRAHGDVVYATASRDPTALVVPQNGTGAAC